MYEHVVCGEAEKHRDEKNEGEVGGKWGMYVQWSNIPLSMQSFFATDSAAACKAIWNPQIPFARHCRRNDKAAKKSKKSPFGWSIFLVVCIRSISTLVSLSFYKYCTSFPCRHPYTVGTPIHRDNKITKCSKNNMGGPWGKVGKGKEGKGREARVIKFKDRGFFHMYVSLPVMKHISKVDLVNRHS